jgi:hypothetical protein
MSQYLIDLFAETLHNAPARKDATTSQLRDLYEQHLLTIKGK